MAEDKDLENVAEDEATQIEENQELEADRRKIWVQIDPYYYLTSDRYNPVILVRFTHPNETRRDDGELMNNQRWYFSSYGAAINAYAHQYVLDHGHEIKEHDLSALNKIAANVDQAFESGRKSIKEFDKKLSAQLHDPDERVFGRKPWHDDSNDEDDDE